MDEKHPQPSLAENLEKLRLLTVWLFLLIGLSQFGQAMRYEIGSSMPLLLEIIRGSIVTALAVCSLMIMLQWKKIKQSGCAHRAILAEAFVQKASNQAMTISWIIMLLFVLALVEWYEPKVLFFGSHDLESLNPARFYFLLIGAVLCLSYSLSFFWLYYRETREA